MKKVLFMFYFFALNSFNINGQTGFFSSGVDSISYINKLKQDSLYKDIVEILGDCDIHTKCVKCDEILFYSTFLSKNYDFFIKEIYLLRYNEENAFLYVFNVTMNTNYEKAINTSSINFLCDKAKHYTITKIEKQHIYHLIEQIEKDKYYEQKFLKDGIIYDPYSFFCVIMRTQKRISFGVVGMGSIDIQTKDGDSNYPKEVIREIYKLLLDF